MPAKLSDAERRRQQTLKLRPDLIGRWEAAAKRLGMTKTAFAERALEAALGGLEPGKRANLARVGEASAAAVAHRSASPRAPGVADRAAAFRAAEAARRG